tara:strand:- start:1504 stop:2097 length:594 start_codon:yes stop_codon:yes gene_type:complete
MKKYLMILSVVALPFTSNAEHIHTKDCNHSSGYYAKFGYGLQDGLNGGNNASEYGLTVGKKLNDVFSAEVKTRLKVKDSSTDNDQRAEIALIASKKIMGPVSLYTRGGAGFKMTRNKSHEYWHIEPGLKYNLSNKWSIKGGVRFRDSFDSIYEQTDVTYKAGVSYKLDKNNSIGVGSKFKRGDSQYNAIGVSYKVNF